MFYTQSHCWLLLFVFPSIILLPYGSLQFVTPNASTRVVNVTLINNNASWVAEYFTHQGRKASCLLSYQRGSAAAVGSSICYCTLRPNFCSLVCQASVDLGIGCVTAGAAWLLLGLLVAIATSKTENARSNRIQDSTNVTSINTGMDTTGTDTSHTPQNQNLPATATVHAAQVTVSEMDKVALARTDSKHVVVINP